MTNRLSVPESDVALLDTNEARLDFFWQQFNTLFKTEEDCVEELCRRLDDDLGVNCKHCKSQEIEKKYGSRIIKCGLCKKDTRITAGTFFNRIRIVRPWLAAIWLLENGVSCSSAKFHKLVDIAYSSAWTIFKKLTIVIQSEIGTEALAISSSLFAPAVCKRSRETPSREHPVAEQDEIEMQVLDNAVVSQFSGLESFLDAAPDRSPSTVTLSGTKPKKPTGEKELDGLEKKVYEILSIEPTHFDTLCQRMQLPAGEISAALVMLELAGLAIRMSGDRYVLPAEPRNNQHIQPLLSGDPVLESSMLVVAEIINFVRVNFHGISRKYLQNYLAVYWCYTDRTRWHSGALLKKLSRFHAVSHSEILAYVSPRFVKVSC